MPTQKTTKISTDYTNLVLRATKGHFVSSHSHSNYYIDVVSQKARLSEAKAVAISILRFMQKKEAMQKHLSKKMRNLVINLLSKDLKVPNTISLSILLLKMVFWYAMLVMMIPLSFPTMQKKLDHLFSTKSQQSSQLPFHPLSEKSANMQWLIVLR